MSIRIRVTTTIGASPETTWSSIEHIESHVAWMADAESITFTTSQRSGVGTRFDCRTRIGPIRLVDAMAVTQWVPLQAMGVDHRGVVRGSGVFTLRNVSDRRTMFSWEERLTFPWWLGGPLGEQVARPLLVRIWRGNLARLKQVVERHQPK
ncbi:MAG: SRPBCC family protein [Candidatus Dormibacteria bacterium]